MSKRSLGRRDLLSLAAFAPLAPLARRGRAMMEPTVQLPAGRRRELYALLGDLPDRHRPIAGRKRGEETQDGVVLETWDLDLNGLETVPAYVARPASASGRTPAVVFNHSHGGGYTIGKQELLDGRTYLQPVPYAKALTGLGYTVLCIDHWVFGERSHTSELDTFKAMLWQGRVLWGMMVYDSLRAVDWLSGAGRRRRLADRHASACRWAARWPGGWPPSTSVSRSPSTSAASPTSTRCSPGRGWTATASTTTCRACSSTSRRSQINALIAPRAHLGLAGLQDKLTPVDGLDIIERDLTPRLRRRGTSRALEARCATTSVTRKRRKAARKCSPSSSAFSDGARPLPRTDGPAPAS